MSQWFHIMGTMEVQVWDDDTNYNEYLIKSAISDCPDIAGSEGGVDIFINKSSYATSSSSHDEIGIYCGYKRYNILNRNRFSVMDPHRYPYFHMMETQNHFIVTLHGDLRDVSFDEGIRMVQKFLNRFSKMIWVNNICVQVSNGYDKCYVIQDRDWYTDNYDPDGRENRIRKKYDFEFD